MEVVAGFVIVIGNGVVNFGVWRLIEDLVANL